MVPLIAVLLSGCIKFDIDFTLSDQTVSGSVIAGFHRDALDFAQQFDEDADVDALLDDGGFVVEGVDGVTREPYEDEEFVGVRYVFDQVPLETVNEEFRQGGDPDPLQITYHADRDVYEVSGSMDLSEAAGDQEDTGLPPMLVQGMLDSFTVRIAITFPGRVLETNGEVSGTTVTWQPQVGEVTELRAVASASGSGPGGGGVDEGTSLLDRTGSTSALTSIVVAVAVLLVVGLVLGVWLMRRNRPAPAAAAAETVAPEPATAVLPEAAVPGAPPAAPPAGEAPTTPVATGPEPPTVAGNPAAPQARQAADGEATEDAPTLETPRSAPPADPQ